MYRAADVCTEAPWNVTFPGGVLGPDAGRWQWTTKATAPSGGYLPTVEGLLTPLDLDFYRVDIPRVEALPPQVHSRGRRHRRTLKQLDEAPDQMPKPAVLRGEGRRQTVMLTHTG